MKKAQFVSPIILILIIVSYFMISVELGSIQSALLNSRTNMLKITNDIKAVEELDLEWRLNISSSALLLLSRMNSSGTINTELAKFNATLFRFNNLAGLNYTKRYESSGFFKTINGTIIVPYPYYDFTQAESRIRTNCNPVSQACVNSNLVGSSMRSELFGTVVYLSDSSYPLTIIYNYVFE